MFVQELIKELHKKKALAIFIKLDISKAFDIVSCPYVLEIMSHLGFGMRWRNWISSLWCTTSSKFMLNGEPGKRILHCRGVRQGDPFSPLLFLLAMEPLHKLFQYAQQRGLLEHISEKYINFRASLYADDAAVFIKPNKIDYEVTEQILQIFADARGLSINMDKTEIYPMNCGEMDLATVMGEQQRLSLFPSKYLGLPLHFKKLRKAAIQPLVQKIGNRLPGWKRNLLTYPGHETLVKSVLTAMPTYFMTAFPLPKWAQKQIDRFRRSFMWRGEDPDKVKGGHCLVNWKVCTRPKKWGGLGIKDLDKFCRALRLRWLSHNWGQIERPWKMLLKHKDPGDKQLFFASTTIQVGDGRCTPFWEARWLNGQAPKELAPNLYKHAHFKHKTVVKELHNFNWIRNLKEISTDDEMDEFVLLFTALQEITFTNAKDQIKWRWTGNGEYSASSAYEIQFVGCTAPIPATALWSSKTEPKCQFFAWLALHEKTLTTDNLAKKNWPHEPNCSLCYCQLPARNCCTSSNAMQFYGGHLGQSSVDA